MNKVPPMTISLLLMAMASTAEPIEWKNDFSENSEKLLSWVSARSDIAISRNTSVGRNSPGALEMDFSAGQRLVSSAAGKFFPYSANQRLTAIVWVKSDFSANVKGIATISFQGWSADKEQLPSATSSTISQIDACRDWKRLVLTFNIPESGIWQKAKYVYLVLSAKTSGKGKVFFDDLELFEGD